MPQGSVIAASAEATASQGACLAGARKGRAPEHATSTRKGSLTNLNGHPQAFSPRPSLDDGPGGPGRGEITVPTRWMIANFFTSTSTVTTGRTTLFLHTRSDQIRESPRQHRYAYRPTQWCNRAPSARSWAPFVSSVICQRTGGRAESYRGTSITRGRSGDGRQLRPPCAAPEPRCHLARSRSSDCGVRPLREKSGCGGSVQTTPFAVSTGIRMCRTECRNSIRGPMFEIAIARSWPMRNIQNARQNSPFERSHASLVARTASTSVAAAPSPRSSARRSAASMVRCSGDSNRWCSIRLVRFTGRSSVRNRAPAPWATYQPLCVSPARHRRTRQT